MNDFVIAIYGSHNASITVARGDKILEVIEVERFLNIKNSGLAQFKTPSTEEELKQTVRLIRDYIARKHKVARYAKCFYMNTMVYVKEDGTISWPGRRHDHKFDIRTFFPADEYIQGHHQYSHASGAFYQSPYQEALSVTYDGGGNDGRCHVYHIKRGEDPVLLGTSNYDMGFSYMAFGEYLDDIKREPDIRDGNLVYPGKIMGLAPYGKVRPEWVQAFVDYYKIIPEARGHIFTQGQVDTLPNLDQLGNKIGYVFDAKVRFTGQLAYDIASTSQHAFELVFMEIIEPWLEKYPGLPLCISGGCGLNIIANTVIRNKFQRDVFVGPNPNDCGISVGMMLDYLRPEQPYDATYAGSILYDIDTFAQQKFAWSSLYKFKQVDVVDLARDIAEGKIVGVARGRAEHGARALGNRSIICDPSFPYMKDTLNEKVKHREWYRPFAPVVRLEDVSKYFEWEGESRWMSFCPQVKQEWRAILPSVTHVDGSARVQTVTRQQNPFLYDLITEVERLTSVGVLLNTSFNVDGKPILSTVYDVFQIFNTTEIDAIVIEDTIVYK